TEYMSAVLEYFKGDGLSSHYHTPGELPMTAYRYNVIGDEITFSVVEGNTVDLPEKAAKYVNDRTDKSWPETFWVPRGMSSFDYMRKIGPNHDANSFGHIGADLITLNSMLRIPVDMHNVPEDKIFRPTIWDRYGSDDFRACDKLGPVYS
ncbi:MAG: L-fucose isomerase, partial [Fibrobacteres bacterium]|nr:L-fucose isomerase [Fibrobacterota bacterium]